jgi:hypothetical protein
MEQPFITLQSIEDSYQFPQKIGASPRLIGLDGGFEEVAAGADLRLFRSVTF